MNDPGKIFRDYLRELDRGNGTTLHYATDSSQEVRKAVKDMLSAGSMDDGRQMVNWYFICLYVVKPEWLTNSKSKPAKRRFFNHLKNNVQLLDMVEQKFIQDWFTISQTTKGLWYLLITLVVFQKIGRVNSPLFNMLFAGTIPVFNPYIPLLKGGDWLIDEFQIDEDDNEDPGLYAFLLRLKSLANRSFLDMPLNDDED